MEEEKKSLFNTTEAQSTQNTQEHTATATSTQEQAAKAAKAVPEETVTQAQEAVAEDTTKQTQETTTDYIEENGQETVTDHTSAVEEKEPKQPMQQPKKGRSVLGIVIGLAVFVVVLALCWKMMGGSGKDTHVDTGVVYAKDNNLHIFDLQNKAQIAEGISAGGKYNSFYSAWGTMFSEDGTDLYYAVNVQKDNTFDLYRRAASGTEADVAVGKGVADYMVSASGDVMIYTKAAAEKTELYLFDGTKSVQIDDNIYGDAATYAISKDGTYMMYCKISQDGSALELYARAAQENAEPVLLEQNTAVAMMSSETNKIYYAGEMQTEAGTEDQTQANARPKFAAYEYTFGKEPVQLMQGVTYLEVMPNGKDVLLMGESAEDVKYANLITDDMAEKDATIKEGDEGYEGKKTRDKIRAMMENGEGISPILQVAYIYSNGKLTEVATDVISAVAVKHDRPYAVCYQAKEVEKMPISLLESIDAIEYGYYSNLYYGMPKVSLVNATGSSWALEGDAVQPQGLFLSDDAAMVGYYDMDMKTGKPTLCVAKVGGDVLLREQNVETATFMKDTHDLVYYKDYINGMGTMCIWNEKDTQKIENVGGLHIAPDQAAVYYLNDMNNATGQGDLYVWQDGVSTKLDTNVNNTQYKYNGKLAYIKNYDFQKGVGDLYYYNGTESIQLDTGVTAIYMF